jgi:hypothetical protein
MHIRTRLALIVTAFFLISAPGYAHAATLFFGAQQKEVGVNKRFEIGVFVNTEGDSINAVEGTLSLPADMLKVVGVQDGGSLSSLWLTRPSAATTASGDLPFSGVIPGGYEGKGGYLFSVIAEAVEPGTVTISSKNERILLNDANGSKAPIHHSQLTLTATQKAKDILAPEVLPPTDITPPNVFVPTVHQDNNAFDGKWFLIFSAVDGESGIDHYELQEKAEGAPTPEAWKIATSPTILTDQTLNSFIYVKAIDRAGNERIAVILPAHEDKGYEKFALWGIIGVLSAGVAVFIWSKLCRKATEV